MTRNDIEDLNPIEPNCFESDREEQWYQVGLVEGLHAADTAVLERSFITQEFLEETAKLLFPLAADAQAHFIEGVNWLLKRIAVRLDEIRIRAALAGLGVVADEGYNVRNEQHLIAKYSVELGDAFVEELERRKCLPQ